MWIHLTCVLMSCFSISASEVSSDTSCPDVSFNFDTTSIHLNLDVYAASSEFETDDVLFTSGSTGTEYYYETPTVYKTIALDFAMKIKQYVSSDDAPSRIQTCLSDLLSKLYGSLEHSSKHSQLYIRCIVKTLIRSHKQDKDARFGQLLGEYARLEAKLKKELEKNNTDLNEIIRLETNIIKVLKALKTCVNKQEDKDEIQNKIDASEKNINDLELEKEINDLRNKIKNETENGSPDFKNLTDLYEKIIDTLKRRKEQNDNQNTTKSITEEINRWTEIKCNVFEKRYNALLGKRDEEYNKNVTVLQTLVVLNKEIINILKKWIECCNQTDEEKIKLQEEINEREKTVKIDELIIKLSVEEAKVPRNNTKLIEIEKKMIAIYKTIKECTDDQSKKNKTQIKIDILEKAIQYHQLNIELNAECDMIPPDLEKIIKKLEEMRDVQREIKELVNDAAKKQLVQDLINRIQAVIDEIRRG